MKVLHGLWRQQNKAGADFNRCPEPGTPALHGNFGRTILSSLRILLDHTVEDVLNHPGFIVLERGQLGRQFIMKLMTFRAVHPMDQHAAFLSAIPAHDPGAVVPVPRRSIAVRTTADGSTALNQKYLCACCKRV